MEEGSLMEEGERMRLQKNIHYKGEEDEEGEEV